MNEDNNYFEGTLNISLSMEILILKVLSYTLLQEAVNFIKILISGLLLSIELLTIF